MVTRPVNIRGTLDIVNEICQNELEKRSLNIHYIPGFITPLDISFLTLIKTHLNAKLKEIVILPHMHEATFGYDEHEKYDIETTSFLEESKYE